MKKVLFLLTLILSAGFVIAATPHKIPASKRSTHALPVPAAPNVVLYDQYDNAAFNAMNSQDFEPAQDASDDFSADDFVIPPGQVWTIDEVDVLGGLYGSAGPVAAFHVFIYQDAAGLPGTQVYSATDQPYSTGGSGDNTDYLITLATPAVLPEGTYWVSVQAHMDLSTGGQWFWHVRTVQSNSPAAWQNPGGGFGVCQTWAPQTTCFDSITSPDLVFRLSGTIGVPCAYGDNFNDGVLTWTEVKPDVDETGGVLSLTPAPGKKKAAATSDPVFLGCSTCDNEFQGVSFTGGTGGKVFLNTQFIDKKNTVQLLVKEDQDKAVLKVKIGGVTVAKNKVLMTFDPNTPYDFDIAYDGTNVVASVNGTPVITLAPSQAIPAGIIDVDSKLMSTSMDGFCSN
jgi:hypothetical protein